MIPCLKFTSIAVPFTDISPHMNQKKKQKSSANIITTNGKIQTALFGIWITAFYHKAVMVIAFNLYPPGESRGQIRKDDTMKANKITLKKIRLEYLETIINNLDEKLDWQREALVNERNELEEAMSAPYDNDDEREVRDHNWNLEYHGNEVQRLELQIKEGEKLLAELEKMV